MADSTNQKAQTSTVKVAMLKRNADRLGHVSTKLMDAYNKLSGAELEEANMPWMPTHTQRLSIDYSTYPAYLKTLLNSLLMQARTIA